MLRAAELRSATSSLENPSNWLLDWSAGGYTSSGVAVTEESSLTLSAVYACNRVLAESIAQLPISLYRRSDAGEVLKADRRPENKLLATSPSPFYTSYKFRETLQFHLGIRGNCYSKIYRDGRGGAKELRILNPQFVQSFWYENKLWYEVQPGAYEGQKQREILTPAEVLHIAALSSDGITGRSPIQVLRETIGIGLGNRNFISKIQKRGGRVDGVLKHPNKLTPEAIGDLRENFKGALQTGNFPILQNGVEYQSISLTPMDAEFINTHKLTARDVAAAYRVPLHMINDLERATFSNIEHQSLEFVKNTLLPWIKNWEEELNRKLLPADVQDSHFFRFNVEGMLRGDFRTRMDGYARAIQWGILNRDEVRELENRNKIPDGAGEIFITPLNMAPLTEEGMQLSLFSGQSAGGDSLQQQQAQ